MQRVELTIQLDPSEPDQIAQVCQELEAALPPEKWEALLCLARGLVAQADSVSVHLPGSLRNLG